MHWQVEIDSDKHKTSKPEYVAGVGHREAWHVWIPSGLLFFFFIFRNQDAWTAETKKFKQPHLGKVMWVDF